MKVTCASGNSFLRKVVLSSVPVLLACGQALAQFAGLELRIADETVPPGGMLQLKVGNTEPRPISKGGQKTKFNAGFLGPVQGIALFSPAGDSSGTAVLSKGAAEFSIHSPNFDMGMSIDYPILTIAVPVKPTAPVGKSAHLVLDPAVSQWLDPNLQGYPVLLFDGILTVGGTLSITDIVPGGGLVSAGTTIAIKGVGFQPDSKIQVNEAILATQTFISANEIDVTLTTDVDMTARRVRVTIPATNERTEYFSYQRTTAMGRSTHPLIASTMPLFSRATWTTAYFKPVLSGSQFSALALENPTALVVKAKLQLYASNGTLLKSKTIQLKPGKRWTRDLVETFIGVVPGNGTKLKVTATSPIPMLGLLGDDTLGTVDPVDPSPNP